jgi:hypothetical protein
LTKDVEFARIDIVARDHGGNMKLYGFAIASNHETPAWFYHRESAEAFAIACGWKDDVELDTTLVWQVAPENILDSENEIWSPAT